MVGGMAFYSGDDMIKNVIFDFGQVMVRFDPHAIAAQTLHDPDDVALLAPILFDRLYWDRLDAGTISDGEVLDAVCARIPERLHRAAREIYYGWIYRLPEIPGMRELVQDLKARGVRVALLSNISHDFVSHAHDIPILALFEYCVFSADLGITKPDPRIFAKACEGGGFDPTETLFVDDSPVNVQGARDFGLQAYLFDKDAQALREYLESALEN